MYEVTKPTPNTTVSAIQPAAGFSKVRNWRQFGVYGPRGVPPAVERIASSLRGVFVLESRVDVAYEIYATN